MSPGKGSFNLDEYVDVAERIRIFRDLYPSGSLQARVIRWPFEGDDVARAIEFIAVEARAYRSPGDERPGVGLAWEPFPGRTPYTKDSELQVAETSAWGRAIVAVLAADTKRGVASKNEIANRKPPTTWKQVEEKIKASGEDGGTAGGEAVGQAASPEDSEADGPVPPKPDHTPPPNGGAGARPTSAPGPSTQLASPELWTEALSRGLTRTKVMVALKAAGESVTTASSVTEAQLKALLRAVESK